MRELNFHDGDLDNPQQVVDEITYSCVKYNIEECGMDWEGITTLFPDQAGIMRARYEAECLEAGIEL